ncbi:protein phosphatase 1K-like protein [Leptotrombidium deliense]|uniref:Protein phosphatase 1K-like protein n=1 Tax=Leptotrombidium deliense TaxID=299467 RepID=A0A443S2M1_9ACAR|nr:protein phosphatase 1K-like protein [Leptotrombidium deliense]
MYMYFVYKIRVISQVCFLNSTFLLFYSVKQLQNDLLYFGIFDGHGNAKCAQFCNENMYKYILYWLQSGNNDLEDILEKSFIEINNAFAHHTTYNDTVQSDNGPSGTTAVVCLLRNNTELVIAHVGDSRALLCRNGEPQKLTIDHNADLLSEKQRVIKSGGTIITNSLGTSLVNGRLAMTRSIGDFDVKPFGVTCIPDTQTVEIKHGKDAFLIMTTDGINFVMNDAEIVNVVNRSRLAHEAAQSVVEQALHYGCDDNATAIVIPFGAWGKFKQMSSSAFMYSFGRELIKSNRF